MKNSAGRELTITEAIDIRAGAHAVFNYACDYRNDAQWRSGVVRMDVRPPTFPSNGTRTREVMRFMGRTLVTDAEIFDVYPGESSSFRAPDAPIPVSGIRRVEPVNGGDRSRLTYSLSAELRGGNAFLAPLMRLIFRRTLRGDLDRLKKRLEQGSNTR